MPASPVGQLTVGLKVGRMTTGGLTLSDFAATALVTPDAVAVRAAHASASSAAATRAACSWRSAPSRPSSGRPSVTGVDAAALMAFAGSPNTITGTLAGTVALQGDGLQMEQALRTARGRARIDIADGTIAGLQLVRTIVTATSGRGGVLASAGARRGRRRARPGAERFSRFGATLRLANGVIETTSRRWRRPTST